MTERKRGRAQSAHNQWTLAQRLRVFTFLVLVVVAFAGSVAIGYVVTSFLGPGIFARFFPGLYVR